MIFNLQKRLNLSDKEIETIKKEQADIVFRREIIIAMVIVFIIGTFFQMRTQEPVFIVVIIILLFLLAIGFYLYNKEQKEFSSAVKDIIISGLFRESFENVLYQPDKGLSESFINDTGLYPKGNRFSSNDLLSASYRGVGFIQSDVLVQQISSNGKTTTVTTYFEGRWLTCDFIKDFSGTHQIRANGFLKNRKPFKFFGDNLSEFEYENQQFNDNFTTYTTDKNEAYYLITPNYMERIQNLTDYIDDEVVYGFKDNKLHVAIFNRQDAFEIKNKVIDKHFVARVEADIKLIKLIIESLDLELDIFK